MKVLLLEYINFHLADMDGDVAQLMVNVRRKSGLCFDSCLPFFCFVFVCLFACMRMCGSGAVGGCFYELFSGEHGG